MCNVAGAAELTVGVPMLGLVRAGHLGPGEIDEGPFGARFACKLDDLARCCTADDRIIDEQHILATKLQIDRVQLAPHAVVHVQG